MCKEILLIYVQSLAPVVEPEGVVVHLQVEHDAGDQLPGLGWCLLAEQQCHCMRVPSYGKDFEQEASRARAQSHRRGALTPLPLPHSTPSQGQNHQFPGLVEVGDKRQRQAVEDGIRDTVSRQDEAHGVDAYQVADDEAHEERENWPRDQECWMKEDLLPLLAVL